MAAVMVLIESDGAGVRETLHDERNPFFFKKSF